MRATFSSTVILVVLHLLYLCHKGNAKIQRVPLLISEEIIPRGDTIKQSINQLTNRKIDFINYLVICENTLYFFILCETFVFIYYTFVTSNFQQLINCQMLDGKCGNKWLTVIYTLVGNCEVNLTFAVGRIYECRLIIACWTPILPNRICIVLFALSEITHRGI